MKIPRDVSGHKLAEALCKHWDYVKVHQVGSHVVLQTQTPVSHRIAVPAHTAVRIGTLNNIVRSVARHKDVAREDILRSIR